MYSEALRKKIITDILSKMSEDDRRTYLLERNHAEVMDALDAINRNVDKNRHSWWQDFGANIAGNAVFDGVVWLGSRLIKKI